MKRILSLLLALLALCDLARGQAVNTLSISNSFAGSNFFLVSIGNKMRRIPSTNAFEQIKPTDVTFTGTVSAAGFTLTGTGGGADTFTATNSRGVVNRVAKDPSVWVTNVLGLTHIAQASVMTANANDGQRWTVTNRLAQTSTLVWTNVAEGQRLHLTLRGAASGGSDYYLTNIFPTGLLVLDSNSTNTAAALSRVLFVQDGTKAELDVVIDRYDGTNFANVAVAQPLQ